MPHGPAPGDPRPRFTTLTLDRRRFLILLGAAAAGSMLQSHEAWARVFGRRRPMTSWTLPTDTPAVGAETVRALIGAAILAPSHWNSQPWRFEVDADELRLTLDPTRTMPLGDPDQRFAQLSLGAALENLLVAARAWGLSPSVQYLPYGPAARAASPLVAATVRWSVGSTARDRALFALLPTRRTDPRGYDGRAIASADRGQLAAQVPDDLRLHWIEDPRAVRRVAAIVSSATLAQASDARAQAERVAWLRSSHDEARRRGDGMTAESLGLGGPLSGLALHALDPRSRLHHWGVESLARDVHDAVRSSGAVALLTAPARQEASAIIAGQTYERLSLMATGLGLSQQAFSAPIASLSHREDVARAFGAVGEEPMLLVRFGHGHPMEPTPRRSIALVSTWHSS